MYIFIIALHVMLLSSVTTGTRNVGTVLFTKADMRHRKWNKDTLALLKARMYFQGVIPPFSSPRADVPEYVTALLRYLRSSYATIRKESGDKETDRILTIAFTDVIGGYLKMFALPIAKYAYYGGTLPKEDTLKLFLFYEDAKRYLHHNGSTWARPDATLLNSVTINVANTPFAFINTRHKLTPDPCVFLSYFEKTPTGLTIPTPRIDWSSCTMFIPLANHSFVNLYSAKRATDLHKYYNIATNCVRMKRPSSLDKFTERFQSWLQFEVVPHLNDDHFYPALQGILSLINSTASVAPYSVLNNVMNEINNNADQIGLDLRITSKKMAIIIIIVLLELAWCIPTLLFVLYRNVKREKSKGTTRTSYIFHSQSSSNNRNGSYDTEFTPRWHVKKRRGGLMLKQKPYAVMEVGEVYSSVSVLSEVTQMKEPQLSARSTDMATMVNEAAKKKKDRKVLKDSETQAENIIHSKGLHRNNASNETWTKLRSSDDTIKTITLSPVTSKNTKIHLRRANRNGAQDSSTSNFVDDKIGLLSTTPPPITELANSTNTEPNIKTEVTRFDNTASLQPKFSTPESASTPAPCSDEKMLKTKRTSKTRASKGTTEGNALKYKTGDIPYLEIRIDRPKQGISVGVTRKEERKDSPKVDTKSFNRLDSKLLKSAVKTDTRVDSNIDNEAPNKTNNADSKEVDIIADKEVNKLNKTEIPKTDFKVSKIPKRAPSPQTRPGSVSGQSAVGTTPRYNVPKEGAKFKRSMIPKLKRAKDDSALKREKKAKIDKLNVTL